MSVLVIHVVCCDGGEETATSNGCDNEVAAEPTRRQALAVVKKCGRVHRRDGRDLCPLHHREVAR